MSKPIPLAVYESDHLIKFLVASGVSSVDAIEIIVGEEPSPGYLYFLSRNAYDDYEGIPKEVAEDCVVLRKILHNLFDEISPDGTQIAVILSSNIKRDKLEEP